ncbi:MAG: hypothetical protein LUO94_11285, partial [Methylococcaceae bacterium]|nr:hypothetical protein [Methylococcaceae bacterium]
MVSHRIRGKKSRKRNVSFLLIRKKSLIEESLNRRLRFACVRFFVHPLAFDAAFSRRIGRKPLEADLAAALNACTVSASLDTLQGCIQVINFL